jgi:hypothetical protein
VNQRHYDALGDIIYKHIQKVMVNKYKYTEHWLPEDDSIDKAYKTNIFMSPNALDNPDKLILLIQGSGAVRPGQWARALCINNSLDNGAMFKYMEQAEQEGYSIVMVNPNNNNVLANQREIDASHEKANQEAEAFVAQQKGKQQQQEKEQQDQVNDSESKSSATSSSSSLSSSKSQFKVSNLSPGKQYFLQRDLTRDEQMAIRKNEKWTKFKGSESPENHVNYVYENYILPKSKARNLYIIAHSAGGYSTVSLLEKHYETSLKNKLRAIGFTDAVHQVSKKMNSEAVLKCLKGIAINWVTSK